MRKGGPEREKQRRKTTRPGEPKRNLHEPLMLFKPQCNLEFLCFEAASLAPAGSATAGTAQAGEGLDSDQRPLVPPTSERGAATEPTVTAKGFV